MTEELAFEQRLRKGGAVDRHEGLVAARAVAVDGLGHELLAGAALPQDEHGGVGPGDAGDELVDLLHGTALAHHAVLELRRLQAPVLAHQPLHVADVVERRGQDGGHRAHQPQVVLGKPHPGRAGVHVEHPQHPVEQAQGSAGQRLDAGRLEALRLVEVLGGQDVVREHGDPLVHHPLGERPADVDGLSGLLRMVGVALAELAGRVARHHRGAVAGHHLQEQLHHPLGERRDAADRVDGGADAEHHVELAGGGRSRVEAGAHLPGLQVEHLAHRHPHGGAGDEVAVLEGDGGRRLAIGIRLHEEEEDRVAEAHVVAVLEAPPGDRQVVDEGAMAAVEVAQSQASVPLLDHALVPRHRHLADLETVVRMAADRERQLVDLEDATLERPGHGHQSRARGPRGAHRRVTLSHRTDPPFGFRLSRKG